MSNDHLTLQSENHRLMNTLSSLTQQNKNIMLKNQQQNQEIVNLNHIIKDLRSKQENRSCIQDIQPLEIGNESCPGKHRCITQSLSPSLTPNTQDKQFVIDDIEDDAVYIPPSQSESECSAESDSFSVHSI